MDWGIKKQSILGLTMVAVLIGFVGIWGAFASLSGAVIASGQIEPEGRSQVVQHPDGGTVAKILVKDGQFVKNGEPLIELDGGTLNSELAIANAQIIELKGEAARLLAEQTTARNLAIPADLMETAKTDPEAEAVIDRQTAVFTARLRTWRETVKGLHEQQTQKKSEMAGLRARRTAMSDQLALIERELKDARELQGKGLMQTSRILELERTAKGLEGEIAGIAASLAAAQSEIARLDVEVLRVTSARQEEAAGGLRDTENKLGQIKEQAREYQRKIGRLMLRAPRSGIVHSLQIHSLGAVIRPAEAVLYVVPQDDQLMITAKVDASHVDTIYAGQPAIMRLTSFDARLTPELNGTVLRVSADTIKDDRTGATFYTADLALGKGEAAKLDGKVLLPGMPVEVFIQTGSRSPLRYALKPFLDFVERAGKE